MLAPLARLRAQEAAARGAFVRSAHGVLFGLRACCFQLLDRKQPRDPFVELVRHHKEKNCALLIQKNWRGYRCRRKLFYARLASHSGLSNRARVIQRAWRSAKARQNARLCSLQLDEQCERGNINDDEITIRLDILYERSVFINFVTWEARRLQRREEAEEVIREVVQPIISGEAFGRLAVEAAERAQFGAFAAETAARWAERHAARNANVALQEGLLREEIEGEQRAEELVVQSGIAILLYDTLVIQEAAARRQLINTLLLAEEGASRDVLWEAEWRDFAELGYSKGLTEWIRQEYRHRWELGGDEWRARRELSHSFACGWAVWKLRVRSARKLGRWYWVFLNERRARVQARRAVRERAAVTIQKGLRAHWGRVKGSWRLQFAYFMKYERQYRNAIKWDEVQGRCTVEDARRDLYNALATRIQATWRGYLGRKAVLRRKDELSTAHLLTISEAVGRKLLAREWEWRGKAIEAERAHGAAALVVCRETIEAKRDARSAAARARDANEAARWLQGGLRMLRDRRAFRARARECRSAGERRSQAEEDIIRVNSGKVILHGWRRATCRAQNRARLAVVDVERRDFVCRERIARAGIATDEQSEFIAVLLVRGKLLEPANLSLNKMARAEPLFRRDIESEEHAAFRAYCHCFRWVAAREDILISKYRKGLKLGRLIARFIDNVRRSQTRSFLEVALLAQRHETVKRKQVESTERTARDNFVMEFKYGAASIDLKAHVEGVAQQKFAENCQQEVEDLSLSYPFDKARKPPERSQTAPANTSQEEPSTYLAFFDTKRLKQQTHVERQFMVHSLRSLKSMSKGVTTFMS